MEFEELKGAWTLPCTCVGVLFLVQSNPVNTDPEGAIESVLIKQVECRENVLSPGTKQTVHNNVSVLVKRVSLKRG